MGAVISAPVTRTQAQSPAASAPASVLKTPWGDVAKELKLDWDTVKTLEMQYMRAQLAHAGTPGPRAIGIDEISVRKGHS